MMAPDRHRRRPNAGLAGPQPRRWLLAAAVALTVARPLVVSDSGAERGDGLFFAISWLLLLAAWFAWQASRGGGRVRFAATDLAIAALALWYSIAALVAARCGSPRASINMLWEWLALTAGAFLFRQLVIDRATARGLMATMVALAASLSAVGYLQAFYTLPRDRAYYEQIKDDPQAMTAAVGTWYPPGSRERQLYEQRLYSSEPTATFALANSLAGLLAPWLVVAVGMAAVGWRAAGRIDSRSRWTAAGLATAIAPCLLLTKSRSGVIAAAVGLAATAWIAAPDRKRRWTLLIAGLLIGVLVVLAVVGAGWWDRQVLTEAGKSLGYRWQYWRATWSMIVDHPVFGCGPGHFQQTYTAYRLPEASEEIQDPHNFLLELWATTGTPGALLMVGVFASFFLAVTASVRGAVTSPPTGKAGQPADRGRGPCRRISPRSAPEDRRAPHGPPRADRLGLLLHRMGKILPAPSRADRAATPHPDDPAPDTGLDRRMVRRGIVVGAACGIPLALVAASLAGMPLDGLTLLTLLASGALALAVAGRWTDRSDPVGWLAAVAVVVMLIHLSASGGITFGGVAGSLWLLLAIGLNEARPASGLRRLGPRPLWTLAAGAAMLVGACYTTAYRPVVESRRAMRQVQRLGPGRSVERAELAARAAARDRWSVEAALLLARERFGQWRRAPSPKRLETLRRAIDRACRLAPQSSTVWSQAGDWWWRVYQRTGDRQALAAARQAYRRAVARYPNLAALRVHYAVTLEEAGRQPEAAEQAARALQLDAVARQAGHRDQQLGRELRGVAERIVGEEGTKGN